MSEPESLYEVFEQTSDEGKLDMFGEALSNIDQLMSFEAERKAKIAEQERVISELRAALIARDEEIDALHDRIQELEIRTNPEGFDAWATPYRMVLDFGRPCPKCHGEASILITSGVRPLPEFYFCGCERPTFTLTQVGAGEVPSFARAHVVSEQS